MRTLALVVLVTACASQPTVVNHPPQAFGTPLAFSPDQTQCVPGPGSPGRLDCEAGILTDLGCDRVFVKNYLGGFEVPMAVCWKLDYKGIPTGEYFRGPKGFIPIYERFVISEAGRFKLIRNSDELRARFAPVTSSAAALSYAVAATGFPPIYGLQVNSNLKYFVKTLEDTVVTTAQSGFIVHNLVDYVGFGCGPHPTFLVAIHVAQDGSVTEVSRVRAFQDPSEDRLCVD